MEYQKKGSYLQEVKKKADYVIDTSRLTIGMLKEEIYKIFLKG